MPEPQQRLPETAVSYWRLRLAIWTVVLALGALGLDGFADDAGLPRWLPSAVVLLLGVVGTVVIPRVRWQRWRYEIRDDEIDLRTGIWTIRRTLVPIRRIQHIDTASGVLQGLFGLATVVFNTAAGQTKIPELTREQAEEVRAHVGRLTRTRDDV